MPKIVLLVGPPGSGKSTYAKGLETFVRVSQDDQGKTGHMEVFEQALYNRSNIVVDRLGFVKIQRDRYLHPASNLGYETEIVVLHESKAVCMDRCLSRKDHPTIKDEANATAAINMFFSKYERVQDGEADSVKRIWPQGEKPRVILCDLDGTLADCEHRREFVNPTIKTEGFKKDWKSFFENMVYDPMNTVVYDILHRMQSEDIHIAYCTGRPDNYREHTRTWLKEVSAPGGNLYMRMRSDSRQDDIVKEIILDFEILTRFTPYFALDDRDQVVKMWRRRGIQCLQVAEGNF